MIVVSNHDKIRKRIPEKCKQLCVRGGKNFNSGGQGHFECSAGFVAPCEIGQI